jgi:predicted nucleotidyltransferase
MTPFTTALPRKQLSAFCQRNGIERLAVFGSALRDDFRADSDIDLLVDFAPDRRVGLLTLARLERELSDLFGGRAIDLRTAEELSPYFRDRVVSEARVLYGERG